MSFCLSQDGFEIVRQALDPDTIDKLRKELDRLAKDRATERSGAVFGMRGVMEKSQSIRELANSSKIKALLHPVLGREITPIRSIFFDKTLDANWPLPWHQDRVIALQARRDVEGFTNWTIKDGTAHAEPPVVLLKNNATIRLHLDPCDKTNGALQVVRDQHHDLLSQEDLAKFRHSTHVETLAVSTGDAVLMRPLTPHSSLKSTRPLRRRVLHLEYCAKGLPNPLAWKEAA